MTWIEPEHHTSESMQDQTTRHFKCLTLNVLSSPVPCNRMEKERLDCLLRHIRDQNYDVVAFQELIKNPLLLDPRHVSRHNDFVRGLRAMGFSHVVSGPQPDSLLVPLDGGIAIYSKHPIVRCSTHLWKRQASWDSLASKGIVHALIEITPPPPASTHEGFTNSKPARMHVMTLHAQATHRGWEDTAGEETYQEIRREQVQQLAEVIRKEAADGESVLVLGDFNFDARNASELRIHQAELANSTGRSHPPLDVVASTFKGDHPATFAIRAETGEILEAFLTNSECPDDPECLDHVYYWPRELPNESEAANNTPGCCRTSTPRCRLEMCEYDGPCNRSGKKPTQVSDHSGWSVEMEFSWPRMASSIPKEPECMCPSEGYGSAELRQIGECKCQLCINEQTQVPRMSVMQNAMQRMIPPRRKQKLGSPAQRELPLLGCFLGVTKMIESGGVHA